MTVERLIALHERLEQLHRDYENALLDALNAMRRGDVSLSDLVDAGYIMREGMNLSDDLRKELKAKMGVAEKLICKNRIEAVTADPDADMTAHGSNASAVPDVRHRPNGVKFGTEAYLQMCRHFGIPEPLIDTGLVQFHYKYLADYVTRCKEEGKPVPPGVVDTYPEYRCTFRAKRRKTAEVD